MHVPWPPHLPSPGHFTAGRGWGHGATVRPRRRSRLDSRGNARRWQARPVKPDLQLHTPVSRLQVPCVPVIRQAVPVGRRVGAGNPPWRSTRPMRGRCRRRRPHPPRPGHRGISARSSPPLGRTRCCGEERVGAGGAPDGGASHWTAVRTTGTRCPRTGRGRCTRWGRGGWPPRQWRPRGRARGASAWRPTRTLVAGPARLEAGGRAGQTR